jgi:hypothetical protein
MRTMASAPLAAVTAGVDWVRFDGKTGLFMAKNLVL